MNYEDMNAGISIIRLETTESTNAFLSSMAEESSMQEFTVIWALGQENGRGLGDNRWESKPGQNLTFSILFHPEHILPARQFILNMAVSLAVLDFVRSLADKTLFSIKWPNDIFANDQKVSGMLIENSIQDGKMIRSIVGIGLNVNQVVFSTEAPNAVSLRFITGLQFPLEESLKALLDFIVDRYEQTRQSNTQFLHDEYLSNLYRINKPSLFKIRGQLTEAVIRNVNEYGLLLLDDSNGNKFECDFKEIEFLKDPV